MKDIAVVLLSAIVAVALTYWLFYSFGMWHDHVRGLAANAAHARELAVRRTLFLAGLFIAFACINLLIAWERGKLPAPREQVRAGQTFATQQGSDLTGATARRGQDPARTPAPVVAVARCPPFPFRAPSTVIAGRESVSRHVGGEGPL